MNFSTIFDDLFPHNVTFWQHSKSLIPLLTALTTKWTIEWLVLAKNLCLSKKLD